MTSTESMNNGVSEIGTSYSSLNSRNLNEAVKCGDLDLIKSIVAEDSNTVNLKSDNIEWTPLHIAIRFNNIEAVIYLIENGANIESTDVNQNTPLHYAVLYANIDIVKYLIERAVNFNNICDNQNKLLNKSAEIINAENAYKNTPLHSAVQTSNLALVENLIKYGANLHITDSHGRSLLHYAAEISSLDVFQYLLKKGADIEATTYHKETVLHDACYGGNFEVVKYLIEVHKTDINSETENDETPLKYALKNGNIDLIKYLVEKGASVNAKDVFGETILHSAFRTASIDVIKYLISQEADINAQVGRKKSLLFLACENENVDVVKYLIEEHEFDVNALFVNNFTPLHIATQNERIDTIKYLIEKGASVNARTQTGATPLHWAAGGRSIDTVKLLISQGADVNAKTYDTEDSMLHLAAKYGSIDILKYFIEVIVADIEAKNKNGETVLHYAVKSHKSCNKMNSNGAPISTTENLKILEHDNDINTINNEKQTLLDVVKYLIEERGADVNVKDYTKSTPLHYAAQNGVFDIIKYLIEKGASVSVNNIYGLTALHSVCKGVCLKTIKFLISKGARVNARTNDEWKTPLHMSIIANSGIDIIKFLIENGADVNATNRAEQNILHLAAKCASLDVVKYFVEELHMDLYTLDNHGRTPLEYAELSFSGDVSKYLKSKMKCPNIRRHSYT